MSDRDRVAAAREAVRTTKRKLPDLFLKSASRQFFRAHLEAQDVDFLVLAAREGDADAMDVLRAHARAAADSGTPVPISFWAFVWEYFVVGPPKASGGPKPQDLVLRNMSVVSLVKIVGQMGFPIHREKARHDSKEPPFSACAIVAQETGLGEGTVEGIWNDGKANVDGSQ
jgi:hypothetical protein